jgi:hypothetical protein
VIPTLQRGHAKTGAGTSLDHPVAGRSRFHQQLLEARGRLLEIVAEPEQ